jgi:hypothetical protein
MRKNDTTSSGKSSLYISQKMNRFNYGVAFTALMAFSGANLIQPCRADSLTRISRQDRLAKPFSINSSSAIESANNIVLENKNLLTSNLTPQSETAPGNISIEDKTEKAAAGQRSLTLIDFNNILRERFSLSSEYLLWSFQGNPAPPPLVSHLGRLPGFLTKSSGFDLCQSFIA